MLADESFASFYRQEYLRIVRYLLKNGASEAEAEDAVQEAMAQAYTRWEDIHSPRAWARRAAFSCYLRQKEKARREKRAEEPMELRAGSASAVDDNNFEEQLWVVAVLRQLPAQQRQIAALFYDGLSLAEIAEVADKPVATVRSHLRHARTRLKEITQSESIASGGDTS